MFRYHLMRAVFKVVSLFLLTRVKLVGRENLPASGPYLVLINHVSHLDLVFLLMVGPVMKVRYLCSEKWLRYRVFGPVLRWLGAIAVSFDPGALNYTTVRTGLRALEAGEILGFAPEATISPTGMLKAKDGGGFFASHTDVAIVPVALLNTEKVVANAKRLRPTTVEVKVGQPFKLPAQEPGSWRRVRSAYTHFIMIHIAAMTPPRYHGHYADSPALAALLAGEDPWPIIRELEETITQPQLSL